CPDHFTVDSLIIKDTARPAKTGTFCVCPLCVTSHIHSPRNSLPLLKSQMSHQHSPALGHPGHPPVCSSTSYSATDPRRFHCASENGHIQNGKRMRTAEFSSNMYLSRLRRIEIAHLFKPLGKNRLRFGFKTAELSIRKRARVPRGFYINVYLYLFKINCGRKYVFMLSAWALRRCMRMTR
uniref:Uncharacterized protein n=1 Tax=Erpetoichthys calabaricus TaxID=27687 RepID=A0A8C4SG12_ERPCA